LNNRLTWAKSGLRTAVWQTTFSMAGEQVIPQALLRTQHDSTDFALDPALGSVLSSPVLRQVLHRNVTQVAPLSLVFMKLFDVSRY
jgi:hypothetical protein